MDSSRREFGVFQTEVDSRAIKRKELDPFGGHSQNAAFILCAMGREGSGWFLEGWKML